MIKTNANIDRSLLLHALGSVHISTIKSTLKARGRDNSKCTPTNNARASYSSCKARTLVGSFLFYASSRRSLR